MSTAESEDYVKRAVECLRLPGACIAESNRQILTYAAIRWRMLAEEAAGVNEPSYLADNRRQMNVSGRSKVAA
jgi:hypothetical protein